MADLCSNSYDLITDTSTLFSGLTELQKCKQQLQFNYLKALDHDRQNDQVFCDFTIITESRRFQVHKCLIGIASDFFKKSITAEMKEKYENTVTIYNIKANVMETVLDYIYGNEISLTIGNYVELFAASDFLQLHQLAFECRNYLKNTVIDSSNVIQFWLFANKHSLVDLLERCVRYIKTNFSGLSEQQEIMKIPTDLIELYLVIRDQSVSEQSFYETIINWVEFDIAEREKLFPKLFKLVNLDKLDLSFVSSKLMDNKLILSNSESLQQLMTFLRNRIEENAIVPTVPERSLSEVEKRNCFCSVLRSLTPTTQRSLSTEFALLERGSSQLSAKIFNVVTEKWTTLPAISGNFECFEITRVSNFLCLIRGREKSFAKAALVPYKLDLTNGSNQWIRGTSMPQNIERFGCTSIGNHIFVAGGQVDNSSSPYPRAVYCYNVQDDKWTQTASLNRYRAGCCLVAHEDRLYVLGGDANSYYHQTVEVFDGSHWKVGTNMLRRRTEFATVIFNDKLYAIGGKCNKNTYCREVEVYDFKEKEWRYAASLNVPRAEHGACVVQGKIYVVGGTSRHNHLDMPMEVFDPKDNVWERMKVETISKRIAVVAL